MNDPNNPPKKTRCSWCSGEIKGTFFGTAKGRICSATCLKNSACAVAVVGFRKPNGDVDEQSE